jgi:hypothetical protein
VVHLALKRGRVVHVWSCTAGNNVTRFLDVARAMACLAGREVVMGRRGRCHRRAARVPCVEADSKMSLNNHVARIIAFDVLQIRGRIFVLGRSPIDGASYALRLVGGASIPPA